MKIISDKDKLTKLILNEKNLGFVPTMGAIHKGHSSLVKKCNSQCDKTVVSIYINKPQFNNKSDFKNYPRTFKKDIQKLKKLNIDYLYIPTTKQIYPNGPNNKIKISPFANKLCGKTRPGHFKGVVDVIDRFIKIINPKRIYFGEKDLQQLKIINAYVKNKHEKVILVPCKTIREKNGIPYSSRNINLSPKEKMIASKVCKLIKSKKELVLKKKIKINSIKKKIYKFGVYKIDYIELLNINKIIKPYNKKNRYKIFIAFYVGKTRLIDNI